MPKVTEAHREARRHEIATRRTPLFRAQRVRSHLDRRHHRRERPVGRRDLRPLQEQGRTDHPGDRRGPRRAVRRARSRADAAADALPRRDRAGRGERARARDRRPEPPGADLGSRGRRARRRRDHSPRSATASSAIFYDYLRTWYLTELQPERRCRARRRTLLHGSTSASSRATSCSPRSSSTSTRTPTSTPSRPWSPRSPARPPKRIRAG